MQRGQDSCSTRLLKSFENLDIYLLLSDLSLHTCNLSSRAHQTRFSCHDLLKCLSLVKQRKLCVICCVWAQVPCRKRIGDQCYSTSFTLCDTLPFLTTSVVLLKLEKDRVFQIGHVFFLVKTRYYSGLPHQSPFWPLTLKLKTFRVKLDYTTLSI